MKVLWFIAGCTCVALGTIGIILPLLPTVPFLLLAAVCFAKSSNKAHSWLINHKILGPPIQDWYSSGAIRKPAKIAASVCIITAFILSLAFNIVWWALALQAIVLTCVSVFIWSRPEA